MTSVTATPEVIEKSLCWPQLVKALSSEVMETIAGGEV